MPFVPIQQLNFLQLASLAGGLPLQWPQAMDGMFEFFSTMSSAGTTLMIPDCELTHLRAADAFYMKQIGFTFLVPIIIVVCIMSWSIIKYSGCAKRCKIESKSLKDYTILSIVLMLFLAYPLLVRTCFSMLKCYKVGHTRYLMADLQEKCFADRHMMYIYMLTLPQLFLFVLGLPLAGFILIIRNKKHHRSKHFFTRYGLLYMG